MGHSQETKARTHERIVDVASRALREKGIFGVGLTDLMRAAGLTVGGFYKHFTSREALVAEVVATIEQRWAPIVDRARAQGKDDRQALGTLVDEYLNEAHRDSPGTGCVYAALAGDIAKSDSHTRAAATAKLRRSIQTLTDLFRSQKKHARGLALLTLSAMVGALTLSRMTNDRELSDELLRSVATQLKSLG